MPTSLDGMARGSRISRMSMTCRLKTDDDCICRIQHMTHDDCLEIGGDKGHQVETINGQLLTLYKSYRWKMIPRCTGRYTCRDHALVSTLPPLEVLSNVGIMYEEQSSPSADESAPRPLQEYVLDGISGKDRIIVVPLDDRKTVGLITYVKGEASGSKVGDLKRKDNSSENNSTSRYVHTFNAMTGFRRKLEAMGALVNLDVMKTTM